MRSLAMRADARGGGDADLGDALDARGDARELLRHDVAAARRVTLDGGAVAADDALEARAGLLDVALELVAGLDAATLVASLELVELLLGLLAGAERVGDRRRGADDAVARLERGADVGQRGALGQRLALLRRDARGAGLERSGVARLVLGLRADATTRAARRRGGRRAAGPPACASPAGRGLRLAAAGFLEAVVVEVVVEVLVFSAIVALPLPFRFGFEALFASSRGRTYVRKPKSWTGYMCCFSLYHHLGYQV